MRTVTEHDTIVMFCLATCLGLTARRAQTAGLAIDKLLSFLDCMLASRSLSVLWNNKAPKSFQHICMSVIYCHPYVHYLTVDHKRPFFGGSRDKSIVDRLKVQRKRGLNRKLDVFGCKTLMIED